MTQGPIGVAVITHTAKHHLEKCLPNYLNSPLKPRVLLVNSSSNDGTVELAEKLGAETLVIPRSQFNHGSTRELARKHLGTDIIVMATPDAYPESTETLGLLVQPLVENRASVAYARQVPHDGAKPIETFSRDFSYPSKSEFRTIEDLPRLGAGVFFCSDSLAAYRDIALETIGGFPSCLFGEDTIVTAKLLREGHTIAYVAEAVCRHSHHYSLRQEFRRNFDIGLMRQQYRELLCIQGSDSKKGRTYVRELIGTLKKEKPSLIPYALLHVGARALGYSFGRSSQGAPLWLKKKLTSQDFYWVSDDFKRGSS